jgi:hypothetical protein
MIRLVVRCLVCAGTQLRDRFARMRQLFGIERSKRARRRGKCFPAATLISAPAGNAASI